MAVSAKEIIVAAVGFLLIAILTPIGMTIVVSQNGTFGATNSTAATYASTFTLFTVLLPILYMVGAALYFIPKVGK
jgi:Na+-driven multidrug efflux pump